MMKEYKKSDYGTDTEALAAGMFELANAIDGLREVLGKPSGTSAYGGDTVAEAICALGAEIANKSFINYQ